MPTGALRAPGSNGLAFVYQSFIDELAHAAGKDPLQFRLDLLDARRARTPRWTRRACAACSSVVREVRLGGPSATLPRGTGMGVAFHLQPPRLLRGGRRRRRSAAQGELSSTRSGSPATSGSHIINPLNAENNAQGAVIDGIAHALGQEITIENGRTVQTTSTTIR